MLTVRVLMVVLCFSVCCLQPVLSSGDTTLLWPLPKSVSIDSSGTVFKVSPCAIKYVVENETSSYIREMLDYYLVEVFQCSKTAPSPVTVDILVGNQTLMVATETSQERYSIDLRNSLHWEIKADFYVGYLRALETFSQLFQQDDESDFFIKGLPIRIEDEPDFAWRGLMIDTSRHYLPLSVIRRTINSLMYNKMTVLHWHITDEDSFPLEIPGYPNLTKEGKVGGNYSLLNVRSLIKYALIRGVRIIPEIDSPAHTQSWGRSEALKDIVIRCNNQYEGQLNPLQNLTSQVVEKVLQTVNENFPDEFMHMGGDQIEEECWKANPQIKAWLAANNKTVKDLEIEYRQNQRHLWSSITSKSPKKAIYWANENINLPVGEEDIIQWWGNKPEILSNRSNKVVLSTYDLTYLDLGFGNRYGNSYGRKISWRKMYTGFSPKVKDVNIIGGEACMWGELSNEYTHDQKIWPRTSAIAERLWNTGVDVATQMPNIAARLIKHSQRLRSRGIKAQAVTVGLCEKDPTICFGN